MRVSVVYAIVGRAWEVELECANGTPVEEAIRKALIHDHFQDVTLRGDESFAVWNRVVEANYVLQDGDRVELLRSLIVSPMERRRRQAQS